MRLIQDDKTLEHYISIDITATMEKIRKFLVKVIKQSIQEVVYDPFEGKATVYERQGEAGGFIGSWVATDLERNRLTKNQTWSTKLFSDPNKMVLDTENYIHGSDTDAGGSMGALDYIYLGAQEIGRKSVDRRPFMDQYLAEGTNYDFPTPTFLGAIQEGLFEGYDFWWLVARDYWTPIMEWWITANGIGAEFAQIMMDLGVTFDFDA